MKKFQVEDSVAIFFDHRKLIRNAYNEKNHNTEHYELRAELFDFHPTKTAPEETLENEVACTRKRKRNKTKSSDALPKELQKLESWSVKCLEQLKSAGEFDLNAAAESNILPRYWEDGADDFPQLRGSNATSSYQTFHLRSKDYLIPPRCRFFNYDVAKLQELQPELGQFDLIVMDPPWRNKYIRRLKRARQELGYQMLENSQLLEMPIGRLCGKRTLVAIWCTNSKQHQQALLEELLGAWQLRLVHVVKWLKVNTAGAAIGRFNADGGHKQPFEMLYIACSQQADVDFGASLKTVDLLLSVPSIVHSHKPPLLSWLGELLPKEPQCLEIFARYLQPNFTSVGLEVLKLMDKRLYQCTEKDAEDASQA